MDITQNFVKLDPVVVVPSTLTDFGLSNYYLSPEFVRLKVSIGHAGGNVSPIKVRPVHDGRFEIVLGYARHRACVEIGLPVAAVVEDVSDPQLVEQFIAHQQFKKWSPWRMGAAINRAIDRGLYPSIRRASEHLGMTGSECGLLISLDRLPLDVKRRLAKISLTPRSAFRLVEQFKRDPVGIGAIPKSLRVLYEPVA